MLIIDFSLVADQGSIVIFEGIDQASGDHVTFGVDHRPAAEILECQPETLYVEDWQVLSRKTITDEVLERLAAGEVDSLSEEDLQVLSRRTITDEHFERYQQNGSWTGD